MPFVSFLPGAFISLGFSAPQQSITASYESRISFAGIVFPTSALVMNFIPSCSISLTLRSTIFFSSFIFGIPYIRSPPIRSFFSYTVTLCPLLLSISAAARPEGPEPITATFLSDLTGGTRGLTYPFSKPFSISDSSFSFTVTGVSFKPQVQAASQRAGHTRPVNSGKLFVFKSLARACSRLLLYISSFHSGMRL